MEAPSKIMVRLSDGAQFRASFPDGYNNNAALVDALTRQRRWYFRRIQQQPLSWWKFAFGKYQYVDTGDIWEPECSSEFQVCDSIIGANTVSCNIRCKNYVPPGPDDVTIVVARREQCQKS